MEIGSAQIGTLLGMSQKSSSSSIAGLFSQDAADVSAVVRDHYAQKFGAEAEALASSDSLSALEQFVTDNVDGDAADALLDSIAEVRSLMELGDTSKQVDLDPILNVLSGQDSDSMSGGLLNLFS